MTNDLQWCTDDELAKFERGCAQAMLRAEDTASMNFLMSHLASIRTEQSRRLRPKRASLLRRLFG